MSGYSGERSAAGKIDNGIPFDMGDENDRLRDEAFLNSIAGYSDENISDDYIMANEMNAANPNGIGEAGTPFNL